MHVFCFLFKRGIYLLLLLKQKKMVELIEPIIQLKKNIEKFYLKNSKKIFLRYFFASKKIHFIWNFWINKINNPNYFFIKNIIFMIF